MTDPTRPTPDAGPLTPGMPRRAAAWLLPAATGLLAALGIVAVGVGIAIGLTGPSVGAPLETAAASSSDGAPPDAVTPVPASTAATPEPAATTGEDAGHLAVGIAMLADRLWIERTAERTGIPPRALAAYAGAALRAAQVSPACGVGWNTLAGVGEIETHHGSMNGSSIDGTGVVSPRIIGIALDGRGTTAVRDTDGGALDGDAVWDHAAGPLQFIPATWAAAGQDGNGDGVRDVDQIDDAALAAALHLCELGGDLRVGDGWIRAIRGYNDNPTYIADVSAAATRYATLAAG